jgi:hypothetical protein
MTAPSFSNWSISKWFAAGLFVTMSLVEARADEFYDLKETSVYVDSTDHDLQFFSPVDFDFSNEPIGQGNGYMFRYDKLSWAATSERNIIGDPDVIEFSEIIVPDALALAFNITTGALPNQGYQIINGIQNSAPKASFAWGERYELGLRDGTTDWTVGILDGPAHNSSDTFGTGPQQSGFGSIHVNFNTPEDFLLGFRDYWGTGEDAGFFIVPTATLNGPGGDGDGFADDLDGDGAEGAANFIVQDINGDGTIDDDEVVGIAVDLDDLHRFNVTFDLLNVRNKTESQGVELMKTHHLNNRHLQKQHQNHHFEFGYGVRFLKLQDEFSLDGTSPLLGTAFINTQVENQIVGPQIRAKWSAQRGRWNLGVDTRFMFGFNATDLSQRGSIGLDDVDDTGVVVNPGLIPGALNRLLSGQPTTFSYGRREDEFAPVVEFRANTSYQLTRALGARLGYSAIFVDNISRASQVTEYSLPDMGIKEGGQQYILINGVDFGFEVVY